MSVAQNTPLPGHIPTITTPLLPPSERRSAIKRRRPQSQRGWTRHSLLRLALPSIIGGALLILLGLLIWDVSSYGRCASPVCRAIKGDELGEVWWRNQGPYAPFRSLGKLGGQKGLPRGCEVDQVTILHRHTARFPTSSVGSCILGSLRKLQRRDVKVPRGHPELAFLRDADLELKAWDFDGLTDQGRKAAWVSGQTVRRVYSSFLRSGQLFTRASGGGRVVETAGYWLEGFRGNKFALKDKSRLPRANVTIPEADGFNNTLSVHACPAFNALDPTPGNVARSELSQALIPTVDRLNKALRPQPPLELDDLLCLADMCGYDSQALGVDWKGWSKWCGVFNAREWEILGHGKDLSRYYDVGQGSEYGPTMGAGYVNELLARLTDSEVSDSTITNRTLDADEHTFPRGGKRLFVDFGHDNEMLEVLAAMGLKSQRRLLPTDSVPAKRTFVLAETVPFGGKITFERVSCDVGSWEPDPENPDGPGEGSGGPRGQDGKKDYVRVLVNDKVELVDHIDCLYSGLIEHGLCELESFVSSQQFASTDVDWSVCYNKPEQGTQG
ncbi:hypothetical protein IAU60_000462 [Kwoniella sp. DSM 27419]